MRQSALPYRQADLTEALFGPDTFVSASATDVVPVRTVLRVTAHVSRANCRGAATAAACSADPSRSTAELSDNFGQSFDQRHLFLRKAGRDDVSIATTPSVESAEKKAYFRTSVVPVRV